MPITTVSRAATFSPAVPLAILLSMFAFAHSAVAQDAKADSATPAAKQSDSASDRHQSRTERRQAEAAAKQTEAGAGSKSDTLTNFPKANSTEAANTAPAKPKMECRTQEVTGSRMGKRICATPEQWAQADEAAAEAIRQMKSDVGNQSGIARPSANPLGGGVGRGGSL
jgi:hypothetical protein